MFHMLRAHQQTPYLLSKISNTDQTFIYFDMPRKSTVHIIIEQCSKNEKLYCTVIFAVRVDRKNILKGVKFQSGIYMCATLCFAEKPTILVLDSFRGHLVEEVKHYLQENKTVMLVFATIECFPQQALSRLLKLFLRQEIAGNHHKMTPTGKLKRPQVLCSWELIPLEIFIKSIKNTGILDDS
ncbi:hypothetical protein PR048_022619 [Dryococelus australis]|uniref:DDE-1 domain-containing protein n=1 Tax=Dryococelus australis TaxID=614101 RepID=A0ABQ9H1L4_9NEOP|nr:hypothetical protein PR048_022619 [Dryococelus australis]